METTKGKKPDTVASRRWQDKLERIAVNLFSLLTFIAFGFVAIYSLFQTSVIDPDRYANEHILFNSDNLLISIPLTLLFFMAVMLCGRRYDFFAKADLRLLEVVLVLYVLIIGALWVTDVQCIPAADSANIFEAARGAVKGDYTQFRSNDVFYNHDFYNNNSYFMFYPFQLGFVFICELIFRIFGTSSAMPLEYINVVCVALAYLGIAKITMLLFRRRAVEFAAILLLAGCLQPILFTPFPYGNVMGMCCAVWACYFLIRYFRGAGPLVLIPSGALLVLSTLAKYNNMIYLVAFAVLILIHAIKEKKWQGLAFILAVCICAVGASKLIIMSYENRSGQKFTSGVSQTLYLDMGLQESYMAPGWWSSTAMQTFMSNDFDSAAANAQAKQDIGSRLDTMTSDLNYGIDFFTKKILSQWNEPSYESIWVSKVKGHYNGEPTGIVKSVYDGGMAGVLEVYFNIYMQALFLLFAGGVLVMMFSRSADLAAVLLPLVLLGGFGYHLLFEGKSQYILTYIILMIPTAAWAGITLAEGRMNLLRYFEKKETEADE